MATLVQAEIWTIARTEQGNAVLVRPIGADVAVPIFIGQLETQSILIGFGDVPLPRPLTHDLMLSMLQLLDASLQRVEIHDMRDSTFFARLILRQGEQELMLDARPSDALALAVRRKCPVFIAEQIVDSAGVQIEQLMQNIPAPEPEDSTVRVQRERDILKAELELAIEREDYEHAAVLRDRLTELDKKSGDSSRPL